MEHPFSERPILLPIRDYPGIPTVCPINSDKFMIGRSHDSSLKIMDKAISRRHCTIEKKNSLEWIITSHSRNAVNVNSIQLSIEQSKTLECGDTINLVGVRLFKFKCSVDANNECRCDRLRNNPQFGCANDQSNRSSFSSNFSSNHSDREVPVFDVESPLPSIIEIQPSITDFPISISSTNSTEKFERIRKDLFELSTQLKKEGKYSEDLIYKINMCLKHIDTNPNCLFKNSEQKEQSFTEQDCRTDQNSATVLNVLSHTSKPETLEREEQPRGERSNGETTIKLLDLLEPVQSSNSGNPPGTSFQSELPTASIQVEILEKESELQKEKIKYLEKKLEEREAKLKRTKEKKDILKNTDVTLRKQLREMDFVRLDRDYYKQLQTLREDDTRNKDELQREIDSLKNSQNILKEENVLLIDNKSIMETEIAFLKEKLLKAEETLKIQATSKLPPAGVSTSGEYCCDIRDQLLDLLDKEFSCCICGDLYIDATVTNCNHIFCAYCLREWKKKKKQCPFCRANTDKELKANVIDECISTLVKLISDKKYEERLKMIQERKEAEGPEPKRRKVRARGTPRGVQVASPRRNYPPFILPPPEFGIINHPYVHPSYPNFLPVIDLSHPS